MVENTNLGNMQVFADNFNYYLTKSGDRKKDVAKKIGVHPSTISDWTKKRTYPRMDKIEALANLWGIEKSDLVEERGYNNGYFLAKESKQIANKLMSDPTLLKLFHTIIKLSPENQEMVLNLANTIAKGEDK